MICRNQAVLTLDKQGRELRAGLSARFDLAANEGDIQAYVGGSVPLHWHSQAELFWLISGCVELRVNGETRRVEAGGGCFINSGAMHAFSAVTAAPCRYRSIVFDPAIVGGMPGGVFDAMYVRPLLEKGAPVIEALPGEGAARFRRCVDAVFAACQSEHLGYEFEVRAALSELLLDIWRRGGARTPLRPAGAQEERIKRMLNWIGENLDGDIQLEGIAAAGNVCPRVCQRLFQKYLRCRPGEYVQRARIFQATEAIAATNDSITEIAMANGFSSPSYFTKLFRRYLGSAPREYRQACRDGLST